jgi:hypothetical protein
MYSENYFQCDYLSIKLIVYYCYYGVRVLGIEPSTSTYLASTPLDIHCQSDSFLPFAIVATLRWNKNITKGISLIMKFLLIPEW